MNKSILIGAFFGCLFGLVSYLVFNFAIKNLGEGGAILWIFPPFWPIVLISSLSAGIVILLGFSPKTDLFLYLAGILNLILWILFGALMGLMIRRIKNKLIWSSVIIGLIFGLGLGYGFSKTITGLISFMLMGIFIGLFIGYIIKYLNIKKWGK